MSEDRGDGRTTCKFCGFPVNRMLDKFCSEECRADYEERENIIRMRELM